MQDHYLEKSGYKPGLKKYFPLLVDKKPPAFNYKGHNHYFNTQKNE